MKYSKLSLIYLISQQKGRSQETYYGKSYRKKNFCCEVLFCRNSIKDEISGRESNCQHYFKSHEYRKPFFFDPGRDEHLHVLSVILRPERNLCPEVPNEFLPAGGRSLKIDLPFFNR